jgi:hypothetical protein
VPEMIKNDICVLGNLLSIAGAHFLSHCSVGWRQAGPPGGASTGLPPGGFSPRKPRTQVLMAEDQGSWFQLAAHLGCSQLLGATHLH